MIVWVCEGESRDFSKIVIDKSVANPEAIKDINRMLKRFGCLAPIEMARVMFCSDIIEQDHRIIKRRAGSFKNFMSAALSIVGEFPT